MAISELALANRNQPKGEKHILITESGTKYEGE
jgi:hypothetical protein